MNDVLNFILLMISNILTFLAILLLLFNIKEITLCVILLSIAWLLQFLIISILLFLSNKIL